MFRWYNKTMNFPRRTKIFRGMSFGALLFFLTPALSVGGEAGIFRAFTEHISKQITKDVYEFSEAQTCTEWFYRKMRKAPYVKPEVERTSGRKVDRGDAEHPCTTRYPKGIESARERFSQTQSSLALSLTFYQFALLGDKNDDEEYDGGELRDVLESVGVVFFVNEPHLPQLTQKFDAVRQAFEFEVLTDGMQQLFQKGYRLSEFDQGQMNRITGGNSK